MTIRTALVVISLLASIAPSAFAQVVYMSRDADGKVSVSDQPPPGYVPPAAIPPRPSSAPQAPITSSQPPAHAPAKSLPIYSNQEVVLFAADWCPYCRRARQYLSARGIPHTVVDIETPGGKQAFASASSSRSIPYLVAGGRQIRGFSERSYDGFFQPGR
jgi:glutaredoxin